MSRVDLRKQWGDVSRTQPPPETVLGANGIAHQLRHLDSPRAKFDDHGLIAETHVQEFGSTPRSHVADDKDVTSLRQADQASEAHAAVHRQLLRRRATG
jgi:hypothetical protein